MSAMSTLDATAFRNALGSFTTGVTVVTTRDGQACDVGLTANSFNSVSLSPPMVLWSLAKTALSLEAFKRAEHFAVHILSAEQQELSNRFARRGEDKFAGLVLERGPDDIPLLTQCAARFVCRTAYQYEGGDHIIFVGEVLDFNHYPKSPLLFHAGQYGVLKKETPAATELTPDDTLGILLRMSYQSLTKPLGRELEKRGLDLAQHFFLAHVARNENKCLSEILDTLSAGNSMPTDETIDELFELNYVTDTGGKVVLTPKGMRIRIELASIYKAIESQALESMGFENSQSMRLLLKQFISATQSV